MKHIIKILILTGVIAGFTFAQSSAGASAAVTAKLYKGLGAELINGTLSFGDIILYGTAAQFSKNPNEGIIIKVNGHPEKDVVVSYSSANINNFQWASETGGEEGLISFTPQVEHTSSSSSYNNPVSVVSGNSYMLPNTAGEGNLYLWVGGEIAINNNQPPGDYTGTFLINISY